MHCHICILGLKIYGSSALSEWHLHQQFVGVNLTLCLGRVADLGLECLESASIWTSSPSIISKEVEIPHNINAAEDQPILYRWATCQD